MRRDLTKRLWSIGIFFGILSLHSYDFYLHFETKLKLPTIKCIAKIARLIFRIRPIASCWFRHTTVRFPMCDRSNCFVILGHRVDALNQGLPVKKYDKRLENDYFSNCRLFKRLERPKEEAKKSAICHSNSDDDDGDSVERPNAKQPHTQMHGYNEKRQLFIIRLFLLKYLRLLL